MSLLKNNYQCICLYHETIYLSCIYFSISLHRKIFSEALCHDFKTKKWEGRIIFTDFAISEILNVKNRLLASAKQQTTNTSSYVTF